MLLWRPTRGHSRNLTLSFPPVLSGNPERNNMTKFMILLIVVLLIPAGATGAETGGSALHRDHGATVVLVSHKTGEEGGWTPLHRAAYSGDVDAVKALLAAGVDADARDENGMTPLHGAALEGHVDVVKMLVAAGADVGAMDKNGVTPVDLAENKEILKLLTRKERP